MTGDTLKERLREIIFGTEPGLGRNFDIALIIVIIASVLALFLDSVEPLHAAYGELFYTADIAFTVLFSIEYLARIYCSVDRKRYITSFYGIVDLLATLPTYLALILPGAQHLLVIRIFRVLRIFRVFKLFKYMSEANILVRSIKSSRHKITVFLITVVTLVIVFGSLMYLVEGPENGFTSLPQSIYWAIVTVTTVGYGDIVPHSPLGRAIAAMAMVTSYAIIAIPTGILSAELVQENQRQAGLKRCTSCQQGNHERDAIHCKYCGELLPEQ